MDRKVEKGQVYHHFKGHMYRVTALAMDSETLKEQVIYQDINDKNKIWSCSVEEFSSSVDLEKYPNTSQKMRFRLVETANEKIQKIREMMSRTPDRTIQDADTILVDYVEHADMRYTGVANYLFEIWESATDKKSVERMFLEFTDIEFVEYLDEVITAMAGQEKNEI